jgi:antitoxin (DNA-binding transcriptional repressor) of toxin-antitoxin stability system
MTRITATEAARQFSDLLNRAHYRGESFEVERNGQVVAHLVAPPKRHVATLHALSQLIALRSGDAEFARDLQCIQAEHNEPPPDRWEP